MAIVAGTQSSRRLRVLLGLSLLLLAVIAWWSLRDDPTGDPPAEAPMHAPPDRTDGPTLAVTPRAAAPPAAPTPPPASPLSDVASPAICMIDLVVRNAADKRPVPGLSVKATWRRSGKVPALAALATDEVSVTLDVNGTAQFAAPGGIPLGPTSVDAGREWQVLAFGHEGQESTWGTMLKAGGTTRLEVWVRRAFYLAGQVVDEQGTPLQGVQATVPTLLRTGPLAWGTRSVVTDAAGRFQLGPFAEDPHAGLETRPDAVESQKYVLFRREGFAGLGLDPGAIPHAQRESVVVTLARGVTLAGVLVDASGRPLTGVPIVLEDLKVRSLRHGTRTDADGRWRMSHLPRGPARLVARAFAYDAKLVSELVLEADDLDMRLVAGTFRLSRDPRLTRVLGLGLAEVDDELRAAYDVPVGVDVLVLEVGPEVRKLGFRSLVRGDGLGPIDGRPVGTIREVVEALLAEAPTPSAPVGTNKLVYTFSWNELGTSIRSNHLSLSPAAREELRRMLEGLR